MEKEKKDGGKLTEREIVHALLKVMVHGLPRVKVDAQLALMKLVEKNLKGGAK